MTTEAEKTFTKMGKRDFTVFWAKANEFGFTKDDVHSAFGLATMKDFNGTLDEALAFLESAAVGDVADDAPDFPPEDETYNPQPPNNIAHAHARTWTEAPASVTIKAYAPSGFDVLLTIRDDDTAALIERMMGALGWLASKNFRPAYGNGKALAPKTTPPQNAPPAQETPPQAQGDAPVCEYHGPMKPSQYGGFYCSKKMADGSYCQNKVAA